jgi:hypothetical protein
MPPFSCGAQRRLLQGAHLDSPLGSRANCGHNKSDSFRNIATHQFRINPQHPIAEPLKRAVPTRVTCPPHRMNTTVNFHDQLPGRHQEINDVPVNRHLTPECNAESAAGKLTPQDGLRVRRVVPHEVSALRK